MKRVANYNGQKAIFTNEYQAVAECVIEDINIDIINPMGRLTIATKLARLSAPLNVGKGAKKLRDSLERDYVMYKMESQETDRLENFNYPTDSEISEYVEVRTS